MLKSLPRTANLIICISFMLFPMVINAQQPADSLLLKDTATITSLSDSSLVTKKKKKGKNKNAISDTTNNTTATKAPAYIPYNSSPVIPPATPGKKFEIGTEILRSILIDRKKN
jgi:hypothetical protein